MSDVGAQLLCPPGACSWRPSHGDRQGGADPSPDPPSPDPPKGAAGRVATCLGHFTPATPSARGIYTGREFESPRRWLSCAQAWRTWGPCLRGCQRQLAVLLPQTPGSPHCLPLGSQLQAVALWAQVPTTGGWGVGSCSPETRVGMGVPDSQDTKRPQLRDRSVEESAWGRSAPVRTAPPTGQSCLGLWTGRGL